MIHSGKGKAMGGDPESAKASFEMALKVTDDKFLLARTLMAYRVGLQTNDRKFFHDNSSRCSRPRRRCGPSSDSPTRSPTAGRAVISRTRRSYSNSDQVPGALVPRVPCPRNTSFLCPRVRGTVRRFVPIEP